MRLGRRRTGPRPPPATGQSKVSRPAAEPGLAGMRADMRDRLGEPSAVLDARLRAVRDCMTVSRMRAASAAVVGDGPAGERWVLVRAGGATVACTVAELTGVPQPVAIAIMTGKPRKEQPEPADSGQPRPRSRRQRGRATKHAR